MMLLSALLAIATAQAQSCDGVADPGDQVQVAWVSPLRKTVRGNAWIEVVRVSDLRTWVREQDQDTTRMLQGLGMKGRRARVARPEDYKITIFDVDSSWLCRSIEGGVPGEEVAGVSVCEASQQKPLMGHRKGYTGCGYTLDTGASKRGMDVYRIRWAEASAWGFCVLPLERFVNGA